MERLLLGLMTHRIGSPGRFRKHALAAAAVGFDGVVLFTPWDVRTDKQRIVGYVSVKGGPWQRRLCRYPGTAIDVGYYTSPSTVTRAIRVKNTPIRFTGYGLGNKWTIQQHLLKSERIVPHLLPTQRMRTIADAFEFAGEHGAIMIKPINGKGGQGILRLARTDRGWSLRANGKSAVHGTERTIARVLRVWKSKGGCVLQRWIDIRNDKGRVFDIRSLVQKNGEGRWQTTGMAVREGRAGSITSNLKSGGRAFDADMYLRRLFGDERAGQLLAGIAELSCHIPEHLEAANGKRLAEFGLDFAVDREGSLWLIEANIKPGRSIIRKVYGREAAERSFLLPFQYARHVADGD